MAMVLHAASPLRLDLAVRPSPTVFGIQLHSGFEREHEGASEYRRPASVEVNANGPTPDDGEDAKAVIGEDK
jgi:hypothetical protein